MHILKFENGHICEDAVLKEHEELIVGVKFSTDNKQTLFTASNDGIIKLWDLRTPKKAVLNFIGITFFSFRAFFLPFQMSHYKMQRLFSF